MGQKKLFSKLDWFSGVFKYVSITELCEEFSVVHDIDLEYVLSHRYLGRNSASGSGKDDVFELLPGVQVRIPLAQYKDFPEFQGVDVEGCPDYVMEKPAESIIDFKFCRLIINMSGIGLDNLREMGYNVDENLRMMFPNLVNPEKGISFHVTRADFAFDFINWCPTLPYDFNDLMSDPDIRKSGLFFGKNKNPINTECRLSAKQSTVYVGTPGQEKLLRIYDKLQQYQGVERDNVPLDFCEGSGDDRIMPDSWIRIELQTRRQAAQKLITGHDPNALTSIDMDYWDKRYWCGVLRWIYEYYGPKVHYNDPVADFWTELFDWKQIEIVIQNAVFVSSKTQLERAESFLCRYMGSIITYISHYGIKDFLILISDGLEKLQTDPRWRSRYTRLCSAKEKGCVIKPDYLDRRYDGRYVISDLDNIISSLQLSDGHSGGKK